MTSPPRPTRALHTPYSDARIIESVNEAGVPPSGHSPTKRREGEACTTPTRTTTHSKTASSPTWPASQRAPSCARPRHLTHEPGTRAHHPPRRIGDACARTPRRGRSNGTPHTQLSAAHCVGLERHANVARASCSRAGTVLAAVHIVSPASLLQPPLSEQTLRRPHMSARVRGIDT